MNRKVKSITIDGKSVKVYEAGVRLAVKSVDEQGIVEAYVSIFGNVDSYGDIVERGAFAESLKRKLPKVLWMHDWNEVIGTVIEAEEDEKGLRVKMQLVLEVQRAKEAHALLKAKATDEFSFGYVVEDSEIDADGHRHLKKIWIYEVSPVLVGANPETELLSVKGVKQEEEEETEEKATVAEVLTEEQVYQKKRENMKQIMQIMDAFWEAYFSQETPVEAFGAMVQEVISLLTPLISGSKGATEQIAGLVGKTGAKMPAAMAGETVAVAKALIKALEAHTSATEDGSGEVVPGPENEEDGSQKPEDGAKNRVIHGEVRKAVKALNAALYVIKR